jgi:flagellar biosynthetic protein FliS
MNPNLDAYKKNQINTASSEQLVLMLYDGARKFIKQAIKSLDEGDMQSPPQFDSGSEYYYRTHVRSEFVSR